MLKNSLRIIALLSLALIALHSAYADAPREVKVGLYINNILGVHEKTETLHFEGTFFQAWKDPKLAATPGQKRTVYIDDAATKKLATMWQPQLLFLNSQGPMKLEARRLILHPDGRVMYAQRFLGRVKISLNLRRYPFDKQVAHFSIVPFMQPSNLVQLKVMPGRQGVNRNAKLDDWLVTQIAVKVLENTHLYLMKGPMSEYTLSIHYHRRPLFYVLQIILPLILLVCFSFTVFWMTHNPLVNRIAISLTSVLAIVVLQWRVLGDLPRVTYFTFLDAFMLLSFIMAVLTILPSLLYDGCKDTVGLPIIKASRYIYPLIYILATLTIYLFYFTS